MKFLILILLLSFSQIATAAIGTVTVTKTGATTVKLVTPGPQGEKGNPGDVFSVTGETGPPGADGVTQDVSGLAPKADPIFTGEMRINGGVVSSPGLPAVVPSVPSLWWLGSNSALNTRADVTIPGGNRGFGYAFVPGLKVTGDVTQDLALMYLHPSFVSDGSPHTITNAYGMEIMSLNSKDSDTTVTNAIGLKVIDPTIGTTTNYAIEAGNCNFASVKSSNGLSINSLAPIRFGASDATGAQIYGNGTVYFAKGDNSAYAPVQTGNLTVSGTITSGSNAITGGAATFSTASVGRLTALRWGSNDTTGAQITNDGSSLTFARGDFGAYYALTTGNISVNGGVTANKYTLSALNTAPATATSTGTTGEVRFTSTGIYICIATNTWIKATAATF